SSRKRNQSQAKYRVVAQRASRRACPAAGDLCRGRRRQSSLLSRDRLPWLARRGARTVGLERGLGTRAAVCRQDRVAQPAFLASVGVAFSSLGQECPQVGSAPRVGWVRGEELGRLEIDLKRRESLPEAGRLLRVVAGLRHEEQPDAVGLQ